ncbi:hypothetical protein E2C01_042384 [Portunus trituberculatus]|uniref:Uncharacterized protein n=1 Tax=Portunus trituberculatus TaxID=210409 RepID=A0A5B7FSX9_PORTR|nr:hypothetical protein [Portunus trituberculatus]
MSSNVIFRNIPNLALHDPNELFVNESGPPLAGVVMQQAYPGGPMYTIPVHWTPFIDPTFIPGETALTPLDPAFTHVIDPKALPIDPVHILPVQHDAAGCPVQVQVRVRQLTFTREIDGKGPRNYGYRNAFMALPRRRL